MYFFLCIDEVQACYVVPKPYGENKDEVEAAAKIIREILVLGKDTTSVATILTGSSKRAIRFAHHLDLAELGMESIGEHYPNLNHQVYVKHALEPLRSAAEMKEAFPEKQCAEHAAMFYKSGGVSRRLDGRYVEPGALPASPGLLEIITTLLVNGGFVKHSDGTGALEEVPGALEALAADPWRMPSLQLGQAELIIARHSRKDTQEQQLKEAKLQLLLAQDDGILYEQHGLVTLLVPQHFATYTKLLLDYGTAEGTRLAYLFQMVLGGIKGSPGSELEAPILATAVHKKVLSAEDVLVFNSRRFSFAGNEISVHDLAGKHLFKLGADALPQLEVFKLAMDMGADGVWFKLRDGERG